MNNVVFDSPLLEDAGNQLKNFGYTLVQQTKNYTPNGRLTSTKVYNNSRNNLQVVIQVSKIPDGVDIQADSSHTTNSQQETESLQEDDSSVDNAEKQEDGKPSAN